MNIGCHVVRATCVRAYCVRDDPLFYIFDAFEQIRDMFARLMPQRTRKSTEANAVIFVRIRCRLSCPVYFSLFLGTARKNIYLRAVQM